jgi:hypothetical protein
LNQHLAFQDDLPIIFKLENNAMSITSQLSTQTGDRTEASNRKVTGMCLENPDLVDEIAVGLKSRDAGMLGDCAEVMTLVAQVEPDVVAPYAKLLPPLLTHKKARVRWEAMHALGLIAHQVPKEIEKILPRLDELIHSDSSVIVRDWAVQTVGNYAGTGKKAAGKALPILINSIPVREYRHAHHALKGLKEVARLIPESRIELEKIGMEFMESKRGVLKKAAKDLLRAIGEL